MTQDSQNSRLADVLLEFVKVGNGGYGDLAPMDGVLKRMEMLKAAGIEVLGPTDLPLVDLGALQDVRFPLSGVPAGYLGYSEGGIYDLRPEGGQGGGTNVILLDEFELPHTFKKE